jgi:hypothetical protein
MSNPAPGWYPAPHANGEQRYWDGNQWVEPTAPAPEAAAVSYPPQASPSTSAPKALALSALIVGIVAFLTGLLPVVGAIIGAVAIILGIIALVKKQSKGLAIPGLVLGAIALIVSLAMTAGLATFMNSATSPTAVESSEPSADDNPSSEPTPSEEPETPAAPLVPRQDFSGSGDMVLDVNIVEAAIVTFTCADCSRNTVLKTNGAESLLVNTIGAYTGANLINLTEGSVTTQLIVQSTGTWTLVVDDVTTAPTVDTSATGTGDGVVIFTGDFDAAAITNDAGGNFTVKAYGEGNWSPLIVNVIGAYSGTVEMSAPAVVQVNSEGNWSITGQ